MKSFWTSHTGPHMSLLFDQNSQCTCVAQMLLIQNRRISSRRRRDNRGGQASVEQTCRRLSSIDCR